MVVCVVQRTRALLSKKEELSTCWCDGHLVDTKQSKLQCLRPHTHL